MSNSFFSMKIGNKDFSHVLKGLSKGKKEQSETSPAAVSTMDILFAPRNPEVNILPPRISESYHVKELQKRFGIAAAVGVVAFGSLWGYQHITVSHTTSSLNQLSGQSSSLEQQSSQLQQYKAYQDAVEAKRSTLVSQMSGEIGYGAISEGVNNAAKANGITLTGITITPSSTAPGAAGATGATATGSADATGGSTGCTNPNPFETVQSIGCVTFTGNSPSLGATANFLDALKQTPGFVSAYIPDGATSDDDGNFAITGNVAYNQVFQTNRFSNYLQDQFPSPGTAGAAGGDGSGSAPSAPSIGTGALETGDKDNPYIPNFIERLLP